MKKISEKSKLALAKTGINDLFPIQEKVFPLIMAGNDSLLVEAPTGSGKTLAFVLPMVESLKENRDVQFIIVTPTEELGSQIVEVVRILTDKVLFLPDGVGKKRQVERLKKYKPNILVGQSSRILELMEDGKINASTVKGMAIDEGDKVLQAGNTENIEGIFKKIYKSIPVYFFSATFRPSDLVFMRKYRPQAKPCLLGDEENVKVVHKYLMTKENKKLESMFKILRGYNIQKAIVFINRPEGVEGLVSRVFDQQRDIFKLHTKLTVNERQKLLTDFRKSKFSILITTDVFSRGLDIPDNEAVIHYDLPKNGQAYVHRSGRTGRGYTKGLVISLVAENEKRDFYNLRGQTEVHIGQIGISHNGKIIDVKIPPKRF